MSGKIALAQPGRVVENLLEIEVANKVDSFLAIWDKPTITQEALQREFVYRPALIQDKLKRLKATAEVLEDEAEEVQ